MKLIQMGVLIALASCTHKVVTPPTPTVEPSGAVGKFKNKTTLPWLNEVERVANCLKGNHGFYEEIESTTFLETNGKTSKEIAEDVKVMAPGLNTYSKFSVYKVLGTYSVKDNEVLYRLQANPRAVPAMVNTAYHEGLHLKGYFHKGNFAKGDNLKTVPFKVGEIAERRAEECL